MRTPFRTSGGDAAHHTTSTTCSRSLSLTPTHHLLSCARSFSLSLSLTHHLHMIRLAMVCVTPPY